MDTADFRKPPCRHMKLCHFLKAAFVGTRKDYTNLGGVYMANWKNIHGEIISVVKA
jgi:hypothetical protein